MSNTTRKRAPRATKSNLKATGTQKAEKGAQNAPVATTEAKKPKTPKEELCVFAFRLTREEREAIHRAAGAAKASKFVRALSVAASNGALDTVSKMVEAVKANQAA